MDLLKPLEEAAKRLLALLALVLLWRPWRAAARQRALARGARVLLVRIDDRVGEALLTTPLLSRLKALRPAPQVHVLVHARCARVLNGHPEADRVLTFDRRRLWLGPLAPGLRALRAEGYDVVVNCASWSAPSITPALVARLAAPASALVGPALWPVARLHSHPVAPLPDTRSEVEQRLHLLSPLLRARGEGQPPALPRLSFRRPQVPPGFESFLERVRSAPHAVVNPGGRLGLRRIPPEAFAAAARALSESGRQVVVTWGPGEEALARHVVSLCPGAVLAPPTGLDELAALMAAAGLTVCNNTGPMHLSVAAGAPTLALFQHMEVARWGHLHPPHHMLDLTAHVAAGEDIAPLAAAAARRFAGGVTPRRSGPCTGSSSRAP